jgi:hypothetical protein
MQVRGGGGAAAKKKVTIAPSGYKAFLGPSSWGLPARKFADENPGVTNRDAMKWATYLKGQKAPAQAQVAVEEAVEEVWTPSRRLSRRWT